MSKMADVRRANDRFFSKNTRRASGDQKYSIKGCVLRIDGKNEFDWLGSVDKVSYWYIDKYLDLHHISERDGFHYVTQQDRVDSDVYYLEIDVKRGEVGKKITHEEYRRRHP